MNEIEDIKWDSSYDTGVTEIDDQHKILIKTLNDAQHKLANGFSVDLLNQITKELLNYALYHFETEEELMLESNYNENKLDEYEKHIKQHRDFSAKVVSIRESIQIGHPINQTELIDFLKNWLVNHINNIDKKFTVYLASKQ